MANDRWHGTSGGYTNHKCRCDDCRSAWNEYCSKRKKKAWSNWNGERNPELEHGLEQTYQNHGCKCLECLKAHSIYSLATRAMRKSGEILSYVQGITQCECCGREGSSMVLDHDHATGAFRGVICYGCNTGIGKLGDGRDGVVKALKYLDRTPPVTIVT